MQRVGLPRAAIVLGALALTGCASAGSPVDAGEPDSGALLPAYGIAFHPDGGH